MALALGLSATLSYLVMWIGIARQGGSAYCGEFYPSGLVRWVEWWVEPWVLGGMMLIQGAALLAIGKHSLAEIAKQWR